MDKQHYVHKRKKRYMAQLLDDFEERIEPHLPADVAESFKRETRRKMNALATDACEVMRLKPGEQLNGAFVDLRDDLQRPPQQRSVSA